MKKEIINILKKYKFNYLLAIMLMTILEISRFFPAKIIGDIIDLYGKDIVYKELIIGKFIMLLCSLIIFCFSRSLSYVLMKSMWLKVEKNIRDVIFDKFLNLKLKNMQEIKNGELMSYITKYAKDITSGIRAIGHDGVRTLITILILMLFMISVNIKLTLMVFIPIFIDTIIVIKLKDKIKKAQVEAQNNYTKMAEFVQESTDSVRTTKAFNGEYKNIEEFQKRSDEVRKSNIKVSIYSTLLSNSMAISFGMCYAISAVFGTELIIADIITVGGFISFNTYIKEMYFPLKWISRMITGLKKMQVAYKKLDEFYSLKEEKIEDKKEILSGDIEIKNLNFSYDNNINVLEDINIKIKKGETLGIIGTIGSGKTTIANLLLKLYDVQNNKIFIDDIDINNINTGILRNNFCFITQESFLFSTSIKENISLFNNDFLEEEIIKSSENAGLKEDINNMTDKIDTVLGEKGITLSGGQKQRVAIARAFLHNKSFVVFDDTFSALDNKTEKFILENLKEFLKDKTSIIISNRISDVKHADKIIVLDKGKIVQEGVHKELLHEDGLYLSFYNQQSSNIEEINI